MFCEKCGNPVNEGEKFCSKCGAPVASTNVNATNAEGMTREVDNLGSEAAKAAEAVNKAATATVEGAKKVASMGKDTLDKFDEKAGGHFNKIFNSKAMIPLAIGGVAVVVLLLCIANGARLNNFVHKVFSSPEKYYQFVEKKAVQELVDCSGEIYDSYVLDSFNFYDKSVSAELSVELDEDGQELLELAGLAGVDLSWLKSAQLNGDVSVKDNMFNVGASVGINKDDILSGNVILDIENENVYLQIPELTKTYLGAELGEMGYYNLEELMEMQEVSKQLLKACPDKKQVEKLLNKYAKIAIGQVDDVSKSTKTIKAEGIQQKATELKYTVDGEMCQDIMEAVLEEMADDKDIEKIIEQVCEVSEELDADDVYEEFQEGIEDMMDDLEYIGDSDSDLFIMKVYVDQKGDVIGRKLEVERYGRTELEISILMPKKGSKFGFEFAAKEYGETVKIEGSGKESGDKISGDFSLKYNGTSLLECTVRKLDVGELKVGRLNGTMTISLASGISSVLGYRASQYASIIKDLQVTLTSDTTKNSAKHTVGVTYDDKKIGTASIAVNTGNGSKAKAPSAGNTVFVEDADDLEEWIEDIDWSKVIRTLDKTDLPSEIIDAVEDISEELEDHGVNRIGSYVY